jgi:hypothetical protein
MRLCWNELTGHCNMHESALPAYAGKTASQERSGNSKSN